MANDTSGEPRLDLSLAEMREAAVNLDRAIWRYFLGLNDRPVSEAAALWEALHSATEHSLQLRGYLARAVDAAHEMENH